MRSILHEKNITANIKLDYPAKLTNKSIKTTP